MSIEQVARGVWHGWEIYDGFDDNEVATAGGDFPDITFHQVLLLYGTLGAFNEVFGLMGRSIPLPIRVSVSALPLLLWAAQSYTRDHPKSAISEGVYFLHQHLGEICLGGAVISSGLMIGLGDRVMGSIGLGFCVYTFGEKKIPHAPRQKIRLAAQFLAIAAAIRYGDLSDRLLSLAKGALIVRTWLPAKTLVKPKAVEVDVGKPRDEDRLEVNHAHVAAYTPPSVPPPPTDVTFGEFQKLFDAISWKEHVEVLDDIVRCDEEWMKRSESTRGTYEAFAKEGMKGFVTSLETKVVAKGGDLESFDLVEAEAKHVLKALQGVNDDKRRARILVKLAVWAGHHCAEAYAREVGEIYAELFHVDLPDLGDQIAEVLAQHRRVLFDQMLHTRHQALHKWLQPFFDPDKAHNYNQFVQLFGAQVGHPLKQQADGDMHAVGHVEQKIILSFLQMNTLPFFWRDYSAKEVIDVVVEGTRVQKRKEVLKEASKDGVDDGALEKRAPSEAGRNAVEGEVAAKQEEEKTVPPLISHVKIEDWLRCQYQGSDFEAWRRDTVYDEDGFIKREYITLMLVHYGFLQPQPQTRS